MGREIEFEKLRGSDNYNTWRFAMENFLALKEMSKCIMGREAVARTSTTEAVTADPNSPAETSASKLAGAKAYLVLHVETSIYVHIEKSATALDIWRTLKRMFEDKGLSRRIGLLRSLISTRLAETDGMQSYIDHIASTSSKLTGIGFGISDEWLGAIILAGLTEDYRPFIMGIEANGSTISSDIIITKLLDANQNSDGKESAFYTKKTFNSKSSKKIRKCFNCSSTQHLANACDKPKKPKVDKNEKNVDKSAKVAFMMGYLAENNEKKKDDWYLDSGASSHMTPHADLIAESGEVPCKQITAANGSKVQVNGTGDCLMDINKRHVLAKNVLHVPDLAVNLLSVFKIVSQGNTVLFDADGCTIRGKNGEVIAFCKPTNGVYKIKVTASAGKMCMISQENENDMLMWHRRLGHMSYGNMLKMRNGTATGVTFNNDCKKRIMECETCAVGKQTREPFERSISEASRILELVHSDLMGKMETQSIGRSRYAMTFIDDFSKKVFCYFLHSKDEAFETFMEFRKYVELQTDMKIKILRTDNGGEFTSNQFTKYLKRHGIQHQLTVPYTPQQNGVAERFNRTIVERTKCLLHEADLSKCYWAEAMNMAVYLINRSPSANLKNQTPEEVWSGKKVDLSNLKTFGCPVMVHIPSEKRTKLDPKSRKMIFVGYDLNVKGYRCADMNTRKVMVSRDVKFIESSVECVTSEMDLELEDISSESERSVYDSLSDSEGPSLSDSEGPSNRDDGETIEITDDSVVNEINELANELANASSNAINNSNDTVMEENDDPSDKNYKPSRNPQVSTSDRTLRFRNFFSHLAEEIDFALYTGEVFLDDEPKSVSEIKNRNDALEWNNAMKEEFDALIENETWNIVDLPKNARTIKTKWVFKLKRDSDGNIVRYKARLVAKGFTQRYGIDYGETYAPVVRYSTIRFLIAYTVRNNMNIHQMDAITAFLQGDVTENIYLDQPEGFNDGTKRVCKLNRALYGLKQASHEWNKKLDSKLRAFGLLKSKMDPCVYHNGKSDFIVAIYVDDFLIFYQDKKKLHQIQEFLCENFKMKDMGPARGCVGLRITQTTDGIDLDQQIYTKEILKRFGMENCAAIGTPSDTSIKLCANMGTSNDNDEDLESIPYQEAVGSLLYLVQGSRPDIAFAINDASRFNKNYTSAHWKAVKRIFRYLQNTINYRLSFTNTDKGDLVGYSDADWGSDTDSRRSCTGYVFLYANGAITWQSTRQSTVALSSTEAEYMALAAAVQEATWLKQLYYEIACEDHGPLIIRCDNTSTIKLAKSDGYRKRTKHIDIKYHYQREKIEGNLIKVEYLETSKMVADSLTKAVSKEKTIYCAGAMGLRANEH